MCRHRGGSQWLLDPEPSGRTPVHCVLVRRMPRKMTSVPGTAGGGLPRKATNHPFAERALVPSEIPGGGEAFVVRTRFQGLRQGSQGPCLGRRQRTQGRWVGCPQAKTETGGKAVGRRKQQRPESADRMVSGRPLPFGDGVGMLSLPPQAPLAPERPRLRGRGRQSALAPSPCHRPPQRLGVCDIKWRDRPARIRLRQGRPTCGPRAECGPGWL